MLWELLHSPKASQQEFLLSLSGFPRATSGRSIAVAKRNGRFVPQDLRRALFSAKLLRAGRYVPGKLDRILQAVPNRLTHLRLTPSAPNLPQKTLYFRLIASLDLADVAYEQCGLLDTEPLSIGQNLRHLL